MLEQIGFYKNIIQNCAVAIFIIDNTHRVTCWNKACENLTGIKAHDVIGTTDQWKVFYGHKRPCLADIIIDCKKEDVSSYYNVFGPSILMTNGLKAEGWYQFLGKRKKYIIFNAAPIYNKEDELIAAIETLEDITEQKRLELELRRATQKLKQLAELDSLTKIANRRKFDEYLNFWWKQLMREQLPLSLIISDIDYFKLFNDAYGHQVGDDCLRAVAKAISLTFKRPADLVARYGGEEFAVILPNTNTTGLIDLCELLKTNVQQIKITHERSLVSKYVSISVGASVMVPCKEYKSEVIINAADIALYEAKAKGRNRIIIKVPDSVRQNCLQSPGL